MARLLRAELRASTCLLGGGASSSPKKAGPPRSRGLRISIPSIRTACGSGRRTQPLRWSR
eukprot:15437117-Alexandrium_andersonii.AAC.1